MRNYLVFGFLIAFVVVFANSCQTAEELEFAKYMSNGKDIYLAKCQNCHGKNGEGLGDLAPPLTDTVFMKEIKNEIACAIKNGSEKKITVHGKTYDGKMPGFADLTPIDIAQLRVYITNSFGNKQGMYSYSNTVNDLNNCQ